MRTLMTLALLVLAPVTVVYADDNSFKLENFYVGGSYLYINPDNNRSTGDTSALGLQIGYELNKDWAFEGGYESSAGRDNLEPWGSRVRMHNLQFIRHWAWQDKFRILAEMGYTHLSMNVNKSGSDDATAGFHLGTGLSTFLNKHIELRGDTKFVYTPNEKNLDNISSLSLNWHF